MARIDDYNQAKTLAMETLCQHKFDDILNRSGFNQVATQSIAIPFLNRMYTMTYPDFEFTANDQREVPIQEQVLILHYLLGKDIPRSEQWVAYRDINGASFYFSAFVKRAIDPLKKVFGHDVDSFINASQHLNAQSIQTGDAGMIFYPFPRIPVQMILWCGDDEFPPEANILFQNKIEDQLSPEDIAWLAGMIVYRLIAISKS